MCVCCSYHRYTIVWPQIHKNTQYQVVVIWVSMLTTVSVSELYWCHFHYVLKLNYLLLSGVQIIHIKVYEYFPINYQCANITKMLQVSPLKV